MILVIAEISVRPGHTEQFHDALRNQFDRIRAEDGCFYYSVAMEDAVLGRLIAIEKWRDRAAIDAHNSQPALRASMTPFEGKYEAKIEYIELP